MEHRREAETDANLPDAAGHLVGTEIDLHPERLEDVRPAALGGRRPVSVLDDANAGRRDHE